MNKELDNNDCSICNVYVTVSKFELVFSLADDVKLFSLVPELHFLSLGTHISMVNLKGRSANYPSELLVGCQKSYMWCLVTNYLLNGTVCFDGVITALVYSTRQHM